MKMINPERHRRVMTILADVMECDTREREVRLAESCRADDSLRREVERLLGHETRAQGFMEEPLLAGDLSDEEESVIGKRIGAYLIVDVIGRGGMGTVYRAMRSDDAYHRQVAIKLIKSGMHSDLVQRRFRNERQILANLDHQNIARLFDGGTTEDNLPYLVMEYVKGAPIDVYANAHKLSTKERLKLFLPVCDAVQYAHRQQVIHRDLKPSNILVNDDGVPKLLDFGIAEFLKADSVAAGIDPTTSAWRVLTPEYASPEQVRGEASTSASDVYSLGAILYELLTGHRPHRLKGAQSPDQIAQTISTAEPEKPSTVISRTGAGSASSDARTGAQTLELVSEPRDRAPGRLRGELRGDLDNILLMALRKEPDRRYATVEEFSRDIRSHLQGMPIQARQDTVVYRGTKFLKRHRVAALATLTAAVVCLVLGIWLGNWFGARPKAIESIAVLPLVNTNNDPTVAHLAEGISDALIEILSRHRNLAVPSRDSVLQFNQQTMEPHEAGRVLKVKTILKGTVKADGQRLAINLSLIDTGNAREIWSKQYDGFLSDVLVMQEQMVDDVSDELGVSRSEGIQTQARKRTTDDPEAYRLYLMGRHFWNQRTIESFHKGLEYFRAATERDPNYARAYSGLADCYGLLGAYMVKRPEETFPAAKAAALRAIELDEGLAEGHSSLALTLWLYDWDWARADAEFQRAIQLNPQSVTAHHWRGLFLGEMGRFDEAIAEMQLALAVNPISAPVLADFGRVYFWARRYPEALEKYHKAKEISPDFGAYNVEANELYGRIAEDENYSTYAKLGWFMGQPREHYLKWKRERNLLFKIRSDLSAGFTRAEPFAILGAKDSAFADLDVAFRMRDHRMTQIKVNPKLDSLRSDPRFAELLWRMNLSH